MEAVKLRNQVMWFTDLHSPSPDHRCGLHGVYRSHMHMACASIIKVGNFWHHYMWRSRFLFINHSAAEPTKISTRRLMAITSLDTILDIVGLLLNPWFTIFLPFGFYFIQNDICSISIMENHTIGLFTLPYWASITLSAEIRWGLYLFLCGILLRIARRRSRIAMNNGVFDDCWDWTKEIAVVTGGKSNRLRFWLWQELEELGGSLFESWHRGVQKLRSWTYCRCRTNAVIPPTKHFMDTD